MSHRELSLVPCDDLEGWDVAWEGGSRGREYMYFCLENSMDRGAWLVTVHGVTKSQT